MESWSILLLGDERVGKSVLASRWAYNAFIDEYDPTLEDDGYRKQLIVDNRACIAVVFDQAGHGQEGFAMRDHMIQECQGFMLIYSITSRQSFDHIDFLQELVRGKSKKPIFMLVGSKADQQHKREVSQEEGARLAGQFGCPFMEVSAKAQSVDEVIISLVRLLRQAQATDNGSTGHMVSKGQGKGRLAKRRWQKCVIM